MIARGSLPRPAGDEGLDRRAPLSSLDPSGLRQGQPQGLSVAVVDDQPLLVAAFAALVEAQEDMQVVVRAGDGRQALDLLAQARDQGRGADVVLMDIRMPRLDGIAATRELSAWPAQQAPRVLILTTFQEEDLVLASLRAGAAGFLLKDAEPEVLLQALRAVGRGQSWLDPAVTAWVLRALEPPASSGSSPATDPPAPGETAAAVARLVPVPGFLLPGETLTGREEAVVALVCQGLSNALIAQRLFLAESTVKTHVKAALAKTGCSNRVELIVHAFTTGTVPVTQ